MIQLHNKQKEVALDTHRFRVLLWGRRTGKTFLACQEMIGEAIRDNEQNVLYLAPTLQAARDIAWAELKKQAQGAIVKANEARLELTLKTIKGGTSTIRLRGWEAVETLRGQKFHFIVLDEVAMYRKFWEGWQEVLLPALTDTKGSAMFISTPKGFNHFYELYNQKGSDWATFHATTFDNPYIDPVEIDKLRQSTTEDRFAQEYLADFRKQEGLVYKEFGRALHTYTELPQGRYDTVVGVDFGFRHPAAVLTIKIDSDGGFWLDEEWVQTEKTESEIVEYAASVPQAERFYPDPENQSAIELMRRANLNVQEVNKGKGSVVAGIERVKDLLRANKLRINKACGHTLWEIEQYHYKEGANGRIDENPEKEYDDCMDAMRYPLSMIVGKAPKPRRARYPRHHRAIGTVSAE
jgi:PBSX family phage terminase large subunit